MIRFLKLVVLLVSTVVCTTSAMAGYYTVMYSNSGTTTVNWFTGSASTSGPYYALMDGYGSVGPTGSVTNTGTITATCTWVANPLIPGDAPPSFVVVAQAAYANWSGDSGFCSDGFGDAEVDGPYSGSGLGPQMGVSSGTWYQIKANPGQQFALTCNPAAFGYGAISGPSAVTQPSENVVLEVIKPRPVLSLSAGSGTETRAPTTALSFLQPQGLGGGGGGAIPAGRISSGVGFAVNVWTPNLRMTNIVFTSDNSWNIQVGMPTTATLYWMDQLGSVSSSLPHEFATDFTWVIGGVPFEEWDVNLDLDVCSVVPFQSPDEPSASWVWADGGTAGKSGSTSVNPIIILSIDVNGAVLGLADFNSQSVQVWRPWLQWKGDTMGDPLYSGLPNPTDVSNYGELDFNVGVADIFGSSGNHGAGSVNFCQTVDLDNDAIYDGIPKPDNTGGAFWLDTNASSTSWYWQVDGSGNAVNYPCAIDQNWPSAGLDTFTDYPKQMLQWHWLYADSWAVNYQFENWMMFIPPNGVWVPLTYQTWSWLGGQARAYYDPPGGPAEFGGWQPTDTFPSWIGIHDSQ